MLKDQIVQRMNVQVSDAAMIHRMAELASNFVTSVQRRAFETKDDELIRSANAFSEGFGDAVADLLEKKVRPNDRTFRP